MAGAGAGLGLVLQISYESLGRMKMKILQMTWLA